MSTIATYLFLLFIAWSEFGSYFGGFVEQKYVVDNQVREVTEINLDIYVNTTCRLLDVRVFDETKDMRMVSEELSFEDMVFFIPFGVKVNLMNEIVTADIDKILSEAVPAQFGPRVDSREFLNQGTDDVALPLEYSACHIFGSIPVNRVAGEFQITTIDRHQPIENVVDFTHVINEFSFGDFFPYVDNPLDSTAKYVPDEKLTSYQYHLSVVPTIYNKMGVLINTNQYSLSEYHYKNITNANDKNSPGIFIKYNFESLTIIVNDRRLGFTQFLIRLIAILCFVVYMVSWLFRVIDKTLVFLLGPRWSLRYYTDGPQQEGPLKI